MVRLSASAIFILLSSGESAFATDKYWTGTTNTTWGTNTNWTGNAPSAGDNAVFNGTFTNGNQPNLTGNTSAGGIWMATGVGQDVTVSASSGTLTLQANTINGTAGLGILVDNTSSFKLTISAPLQIGNAQTWMNSSGNLLTISGAVNLNNKGLTINGTGNTTISGVISNGGGFTKAGSGTLTLSNTSDSYTGQLTVQAGTLKIDTINNISSNGELGNNALAVILGSSGATGTLEYSGSTASSTKTFTMATSGTGAFQVDSAGTTLTLSGIIGGSGGLTKTGSGTMVLSGINTYSGGTNINGGTLNLGGATAIGSSGTISFGGGTLQFSASNTTDYSSRFSNASNQAYSIDTNSQSVTLATALTSSGGSLTKLGSGALTLSGANTYNGGTTVSAGTLKISGSGTFGSTAGSLTVNGGTVDLNGTNQGVGNLTGSGGTILNNSTGTSATLTIGNSNGGGGNYAGVIADHSSGTGMLAVTKTGSGTITLSGTNTFTGTTTINGGTLTAAGTSGSALGSTTSIIVNSGGTLLLGGNDQINNSATMTLNGGTFSKGNFSEGTSATGSGGSGVGALTLQANSHIDFGTGTTGVLRFASFNPIFNGNTFTLTIDNWAGNYNQQGSGTTDRLLFDSDPSAYLADFYFTGYGAGGVEFNLGSGLFEVVAGVPEPGTWLTGFLICLGLANHRLKRGGDLISRFQGRKSWPPTAPNQEV